jgi:hypothetical protein
MLARSDRDAPGADEPGAGDLGDRRGLRPIHRGGAGGQRVAVRMAVLYLLLSSDPSSGGGGLGGGGPDPDPIPVSALERETAAAGGTSRGER